MLGLRLLTSLKKEQPPSMDFDDDNDGKGEGGGGEDIEVGSALQFLRGVSQLEKHTGKNNKDTPVNDWMEVIEGVNSILGVECELNAGLAVIKRILTGHATDLEAIRSHLVAEFVPEFVVSTDYVAWFETVPEIGGSTLVPTPASLLLTSVVS